jgi:hypothetical protein
MSVDEVVLKQYWRVLHVYGSFEVFSNKIYFFSKTLQLNRNANAITHHRNILETQKPVEVLNYTSTRIIHNCQKNLILSRDPVPIISLVHVLCTSYILSEITNDKHRFPFYVQCKFLCLVRILTPIIIRDPYMD